MDEIIFDEFRGIEVIESPPPKNIINESHLRERKIPEKEDSNKNSSDSGDFICLMLMFIFALISLLILLGLLADLCSVYVFIL